MGQTARVIRKNRIRLYFSMIERVPDVDRVMRQPANSPWTRTFKEGTIDEDKPLSPQADEIIMVRLPFSIHNLGEMMCTLLGLLPDAARFLVLCLRPAWVAHYNEGRPHMSLGPGVPQP